MIAQKMMIAVRPWASVIARAPMAYAEQTQHVGPLAPEEVADLAADQDERGGDQGLERDRGLDAADGRVEILDHRGDRDVHQRRVDDEHEHRHRQQDGEPGVARSGPALGVGPSQACGVIPCMVRADHVETARPSP